MITDPNGLALLFLNFLATWPEPRSELPARASLPSHGLINTGVWGYQLYLFYEQVLDRWGEKVQQRVEQAHTRILGADRGSDLSAMTNIIADVIRHGRPEVEHLLRNGGGDDRGAAIDLTVALALLEPNDLSDRLQKPGAVISEYHFADCLGRGRKRIDTAFTPLITILEMAGEATNASSAQIQSSLKYHEERT